MKKFIAALAFTAIIASPSFAATKKVVKKTTTTTTTPATEAPAPAATTYAHSTPIWSVAFNLGTAGSKFVFGPTLKAQWPVNLSGNAFKFGGRTGFLFGPSDPTTFTIPILATAQYDIATSNQLKPYVGLEMGITWTHISGGASVTFGGNTYGGSTSSTDFAVLAVPGVNFGDNHMYFAELPLGVISSSFTIIPGVGMHF